VLFLDSKEGFHQAHLAVPKWCLQMDMIARFDVDSKTMLRTSRDASTQNHWDAIVIGSGAAGSTLALRLAERGVGVLLVERGDFLKPNCAPRMIRSADSYRCPEGPERAPGPLLVGKPNFTELRFIDCERATFAPINTSVDCRLLGPSAIPISSPTIKRLRRSTGSMARSMGPERSLRTFRRIRIRRYRTTQSSRS
jgi:hypothetical protein